MTPPSVSGGSRGPLAIGIGLYLALTAVLLWLGLRQTGRAFVYAQDDPYIHLSLARTLADHGVWGLRSDQFASASSSPLWTLLLAAVWSAGAHAVWWPFVLNIVCGVGVLAVADAMTRDFMDRRSRAILLAALVAITPLPTLALIGMEHTLQVLLSIALAWQSARWLEGEDTVRTLTVCALAAALTATRYEGLFLVAAVASLLVMRQRIGHAAALVVAAFVPIAVYAAYSVSNGALVLPNSVLMKSQPGRFGTLADGIGAVLRDSATVFSLFSRPPELALTLGLLLAISRAGAMKTRAVSRAVVLGSIFTIAMLLHACLVKLEWFYRYEAALIGLGVLALASLVAQRESRAALLTPLMSSAAGTTLVALLALPLATRALSALAVTPGAMRNVFEQQYQMGRFFSAAYPDDTIAVNDIGAVAWLSSSRIVDIYGLATQEVANLKRQRQWDRASLEAIAVRRQVRAVAMYQRVFEPIIPRSWTLVGEWTIANNVGVSEDTVGFYAPTPGDVKRLHDALDAFATALPGTVKYNAVSK